VYAHISYSKVILKLLIWWNNLGEGVEMEERAAQLPVHGYVYSQSGITNCEHGIVPGMYWYI